MKNMIALYGCICSLLLNCSISFADVNTIMVEEGLFLSQMIGSPCTATEGWENDKTFCDNVIALVKVEIERKCKALGLKAVEPMNCSTKEYERLTSNWYQPACSAICRP